ncbi:GNAT family N-acetyltransferase [Chelativorans sp. M5D2P16]|uniref:GNAT family N-acetyltransferase n=1 Tax=Chelativorans sp. M5D2P16 TaxID=3095678 RepID=UPI002ACA37CF|nr:GNAT family N-acetyltransferase [Chelativorans sp. M5D2P16]MDZ5696889.1 GNAT family N-acetyltransferase [Chelativorans sp. M5D2P16]
MIANSEASVENPIEIRCLVSLPDGIEDLCAEAAGDGFRFMGKLTSGWEAGTNRFDRPGEVLLGAFRGDMLVAVGGLNVDPYTTKENTGRLRHLYVLKSARREGIASMLVRYLLDAAQSSFACVRVFTDTQEGTMFYDDLGFSRSASPTASHIMPMPKSARRR